MKNNKKLEVTYKLIRQLKDKLKLKDNYKGLLSVATYLVTLYFEDYYKKEEYEYFTEYKILILILEITKWLAVADSRYQFGYKKFNFKKHLREIEEELKDVKKGVILMWKNNLLNEKLKKVKQKLSNTENKTKHWELELYTNMLEDLIRKYPEYKLELNKDFRKEIGYVK